MLAWLATRPTVVDRLARSPLTEWLGGSPARLSEQGYAKDTLRKRANYLLDFGDFLVQQAGAGLDLRNISAWVEPFLAQPLSGNESRSPRCPFTPMSVEG